MTVIKDVLACVDSDFSKLTMESLKATFLNNTKRHNIINDYSHDKSANGTE